MGVWASSGCWSPGRGTWHLTLENYSYTIPGAGGKQTACFPWADKRRDGRGGAGGGRHAPEEGGDGAAVRRIHRPAWYVRVSHAASISTGVWQRRPLMHAWCTVRSVVLRQIIGDAAAVMSTGLTGLTACVRACRRVWDAGGAAGGHYVGAAGHPPQAGKLKRLPLARSPCTESEIDDERAICLPRSFLMHTYIYAGRAAERGRLLQLAADLHRQGRGGGLHQPQRPPHHRPRAHRAGAHGQARGVRALPRHGGVHAQLGDGQPAGVLTIDTTTAHARARQRAS
jgi:hypothetical protein